ncbi:glycosyltransferase family 4 protein [Glutamicibacter ardleyensis]|uniref:D-inositol 3-phosphate glycosyltransferase n=1 Tax=Glutamicibacter ardleyensis TaxID=225894 RepID=A0ABQ2DJQ9_9MICC|nr:glycosyltransferase family 4 protein [Glutamicibacter ardleyensis]GGJ60506.1 glycosyltransferase WbuB [Glutamicibacter ardleyensis]
MNTQLLSNLTNTGFLVVSNLADDPSYFALQASRKFKNRVPVKILDKVLALGKNIGVASAFSAMIRDDSIQLQTTCRLWLEESGSKRGAVFLANLCIASGEWDTASCLLEHAKSSRSTVRARARLQWGLGNMSEAIALLEKIPPNRQKRHYVSEYKVYSGAEPKLPPTRLSDASSDGPASVVFLATNSLPHTGSGYAQRTQSTLAALAADGWKTQVCTRVNYPLNIGVFQVNSSDQVGLVEYERLLPVRAKYDLSGRIQQQAELLLSKVVRDRPQILHTTTDFSNALAVKAVSEATGIPWVYEVRGQLADTWLSTRPESAENSERYKLFREREAYVAKSADHVITLGDQMKENLTSAGVEAAKIEILPNGIGDEFLNEPVDRSTARHELGLDVQAFYVGTVSSLVPYEGLDTVLRAVATLQPEKENLKVLIVGDGTDRENLMRLAAKLGISKYCEFTGRVPREKAHLYHAALNLFVVPRKDSAVTRAVTPLKPVEALASRVPVLASDLPALGELIEDGITGYLVDSSDVDQWASTIDSLMRSPEKISSMGESGRDLVLKTRTWSRNAKKLDSVYRSVINKTL